MRREPRAFRPEAMPLESKLLLSLASPALGAKAAPAQVTIAATDQAASLVTGTYFAAEDGRAADAPLDVKLDGTGRVRGVGAAALSGSLQFGGFLPTDRPDISGTVTLKNARGSVTVRLTGFGGNGPVAESSFKLKASVVKGTGQYRTLRRIGTATAQFGPNMVRSIKAPSPIGGDVTLKFDLKPPAR